MLLDNTRTGLNFDTQGGTQNFVNELNTYFSDSDSPYEDTYIECNYYKVDDFLNTFSENTTSLSIMSLNIQSLPAKFNELNLFLNDSLFQTISPLISLACKKFGN